MFPLYKRNLPLILSLIFSFLLVKSDTTTIYQCPDDVTYLKRRVCAIKSAGINSNINYLNIYSNCRSEEFCSKYSDDLYTCVKKVELLKIGKKCNLNEECRTGLCENNKCKAKGTGESCTADAECGNGSGCAENGSGKHCAELAKNEGDACGPAVGKICGYGLKCHDNKCTKFGSLEDGAAADKDTEEILCKSGIVYVNKCDSVVTATECTSDSHTAIINFKNAGQKTFNCIKSNYAEDGTTINYYHDYYSLRTDIFKEYLEEFNKVDLDDLYDNDKYDIETHGEGLGKWKLKKMYLKYKNFGYLKYYNLIDDEGEVNSDNSCVYDYYIKEQLSSFMTINVLFGLCLFAMLF